MTPILVETLGLLGYDFEIVQPDHIEMPHYVEAWDRTWESSDQVRAAVARVSMVYENPQCDQKDCPRSQNLLIQRSGPHRYYMRGGAANVLRFGIRRRRVARWKELFKLLINQASKSENLHHRYKAGAAEIPGYGIGRRAVANWPEVCRYLARQGINHALYEPGRHSLGCQIATFGNARRIVGMRGAEFANMIWSTHGVRARVLDPAPPATVLAGFFDRLEVRHEFAVVDQTLASEDPLEVARFLTEP